MEDAVEENKTSDDDDSSSYSNSESQSEYALEVNSHNTVLANDQE